MLLRGLRHAGATETRAAVLPRNEFQYAPRSRMDWKFEAGQTARRLVTLSSWAVPPVDAELRHACGGRKHTYGQQNFGGQSPPCCGTRRADLARVSHRRPGVSRQDMIRAQSPTLRRAKAAQHSTAIYKQHSHTLPQEVHAQSSSSPTAAQAGCVASYRRSL